jgi:hypothetical protein
VIRTVLPVVGLVLVLAAACSSSPSSAPSPTLSSDPLAPLVVTSVPAGFDRRADSQPGAGPVTLAGAAEQDGTDGARAALTGEGFRRGYQALWLAGDGQSIGVRVSQFATAAGAQRDRARLLADQAASPGTVTRFAVPGVPATAGGGVEVDVEGHTVSQVVVTSGPRTALLVWNSMKRESLRSRLAPLARAQYRQLSGR